MQTSSQDAPQYERGPFPFGDGERILDIRFDPVFKAVFTRETDKSRGALSDLISALIGKTVVVETIVANEPPVDDIRQRNVRFDVACKTKQDELVNVEMSFNPGADEPARLEYYAAKLFTGQNIHGKDKTYGDLKETYQIAILSKDRFFPDGNFAHAFLYYDPDTRVSFGGKTRIITVELVKTKRIADKPVKQMTNAEAWAVFFQYLTDPRKRAKILQIINHEEGIAMAAATLGTFTQSEIEYIRETTRLKGELDWQSQMAGARRKGHEEGLAKGLTEGLTKGLAKGLTKGRSEASLDIARKMKSRGRSFDEIAEDTGLSPETIANL
jgi:predicted transposase/invertase (TIGR01784 family)